MRKKELLKYQKRSADLADLSFVDRIKYWSVNSPTSMKKFDTETFNKLLELTSNLDEKASIRQRMWHVLNSDYSLQICKANGCDKKVKWNYEKKNYNTFCSVKCRASDPSMILILQSEQAKQKRRSTNIKKYGGISPSASKEVTNKIKNTNLQKYGVSCPLAIPEKRDGYLKQYSVSNVSQLQHIKEKKIQTFQKRYGVDNAFNIPQLVKICRFIPDDKQHHWSRILT
jgi:hypothetical protein